MLALQREGGGLRIFPQGPEANHVGELFARALVEFIYKILLSDNDCK